MQLRIIGDVHGYRYELQQLLHCSADGIIQLGDLGVGFGQSDYWHESVDDELCAHRARFIRGNHDNPATCRGMASWIADGHVERLGDHSIMYIGGAWSIDNPDAPPGWRRRSEGSDWWADEECSDQQFEDMYAHYCAVRPDVLITHDCPSCIAKHMFWGSGLIKGPQYYSRTADWLDRFFQAHQPQQWFFGHWHRSMSVVYGETQFHCVGELDCYDTIL